MKEKYLQVVSLTSKLNEELQRERSRNYDLTENFKRTRRLLEELQGSMSQNVFLP
jgi:hypothetical protein